MSDGLDVSGLLGTVIIGGVAVKMADNLFKPSTGNKVMGKKHGVGCKCKECKFRKHQLKNPLV